MSAPGSGIRVASNEGEALWAFNALYTIKVPTDRAGGDLAVFECEFDRAGNVPLHLHRRESEVWFVLEGRVDFQVDQETLRSGPGDLVLGPRGVPHRFGVVSDRARLLVATAPGGFDAFLRAAGRPAGERATPTPVEMDIEAAAQMAAAHGLDLLGPPLP